MKIYIHDIEVFPNFFSVTIKEVNGNTFFYEISERRNDIEELRNFYNNLKDKFLVGFNSRAYDDIIIGVMLQYDVDNSSIYKLSQKVINTKNIWESPFKKYLYPNWFQVDLYLYWSKNLRISKKLSLKSLGIQMNYPVTMDLPYDFDKELTFEEMNQVLEYNIHDVNITEMLFLKKKQDFQQRVEVYNEYGIECFSYDDPKIGMKILEYTYKQKYGYDLNIATVYNGIKLNDIILESIISLTKNLESSNKNSYDTFYSLKDLVDNLRNKTVYGSNGLKYSLITPQKNRMILKSDFGSGGIHGVAFKGVLEPKDDECLLDADVNSYYPSFIQAIKVINEVLDIYIQIKTDRFKYKKLSKDKSLSQEERNKYNMLQSRYKLILNSVYGMLGNEYSSISNLKDLLSVTLNGQLMLSAFGQILIRKFDCSVVYENTKPLVL